MDKSMRFRLLALLEDTLMPARVNEDCVTISDEDLAMVCDYIAELYEDDEPVLP